MSNNQAPGVLIVADATDGLSCIVDESVDCCVTSPPYWLQRDYGFEGQIGLEVTPQEYVERLTEVFRALKPKLKATATVWLVMGETYAGYWGCRRDERNSPCKADTNGWTRGFHMNARPRFHDAFKHTAIKPTDMVGIPWMVAFALREAGYYLRADVIWHKGASHENVRTRPRQAHEHIFMLTVGNRGYYYQPALAESYGNVWTIRPQASQSAHTARFPLEIPRRCIEIGCPLGGLVLDPFMGSGTTAEAALQLNRRIVGIDLDRSSLENTCAALNLGLITDYASHGIT